MKNIFILLSLIIHVSVFAADILPRQIEGLVKSVNTYLDRAEQELNSKHENKNSSAKRQLENAQETIDELFGSRYGSKFDHQHPQIIAFQNRMVLIEARANDKPSATRNHTNNDALIKSSDLNFTAVNYEVKKIYKNLKKIQSINQSKITSGPIFDNAGLNSQRALKTANDIYDNMMDGFAGSINVQSQAYKDLKAALQEGLVLTQLANNKVSKAQALQFNQNKENIRVKAQQKAATDAALQAEYATQRTYNEKVELQAATIARFPIANSNYQNEKLSGLAVSALRQHYPNHVVLRYYLVGPGVIKQQALIEGDALTFGTYNFLNVIVAMRERSGKTRVYYMVLTQAQQSDGTWANPVVNGSYDSSYGILEENVNK